MWRCITRSVRDLKYSAPPKQVDENVTNPTSILKKKKKSSLPNCRSWNPACFQWVKPCSFTYEQSKQSSQDNFNHQPHTLFEAFGWSGAIVFGWYIGQTILRNRNYFFSKTEPDSQPKRTEFEYKTLSDVVTKVVFAQPQYKSILPVEAHGPSYKNEQTEIYGPITREDNFNEAALEFYDVHKEMIAELENVRGLKLLKKNKLDDAFSHFKQAVLLNHSAAAFNLAQCYENGWGTQQDLSQAVYYYEMAKSQGHVSAIYNLGVYYSNGLGGLNMDKCKANELFLTAAKLGHEKAAQLTGLVQCPAPSLEDLSQMFEEQNTKSPYPGQIIEAVETYMKTNDITPDEAYHSDEQESPLWDSFVKEVHEYTQLCHTDKNVDSNKVAFVF